MEAAKLAVAGAKTEKVHAAALAIASDCEARDDMCEVEAVFNAVKTGTNKVRSLRRGVRYVNDPVRRDLFKRPDRLLTFCEEGACAGDCDDQAMLVTALLLNLGFHAGLRIFKPDGAKSFEHIYAVVQLPKLNPKNWVGLDTTVPHATVGWEPEGGRTLTVDLSVME